MIQAGINDLKGQVRALAEKVDAMNAETGKANVRFDGLSATVRHHLAEHEAGNSRLFLLCAGLLKMAFSAGISAVLVLWGYTTYF